MDIIRERFIDGLTVQVIQVPCDPRGYLDAPTAGAYVIRRDGQFDHYGNGPSAPADAVYGGDRQMVFNVIYAYRHGDVAYAIEPWSRIVGPERARWDSYPAGFVVSQYDRIRETHGVKYVTKRIRDLVRQEHADFVKQIAAYENGECYGFRVLADVVESELSDDGQSFHHESTPESISEVSGFWSVDDALQAGIDDAHFIIDRQHDPVLP